MAENVEPPDEIYGFGALLIWMVATRATSVVEQVFSIRPVCCRPEYGEVDGHPLPTAALIAWLITAGEYGLPPEQLARRTPAMKDRQHVIRTTVSRAIGGKPHLFEPQWLSDLAVACGFSEEEVEVLRNGRGEIGRRVETGDLYKELRPVIRRGFRSVSVPGARVAAMAEVTRTLPPETRDFTGRDSELLELAGTTHSGTAGGAARVCVIDGMAGAGKTTFAVHFARRFAESFTDGPFFVRLHGHSRDRRPVDPHDALSALLSADRVAPQMIPADPAERAKMWRERIAGRRSILLLDDATGARQIRPLVPDSPDTLVLVTSRRRLTVLPGAHLLSLGTLAPADAAVLFVRLAGRAGLEPGDAGVADVVRLCGYLPQAISLLAGHLKHHRARTVGDLITAMTVPGIRLALLVDEHGSIAAAFDLSYRNLSPDLRRLFRRLGLHPGPDIDSYTAGVLSDSDPASAHAQVRRLASYHLIDEAARGRYRFHELIGEHARSLAATDPPAERAAAELRLLDYYLYMVRAAGRHLIRRTATGVPSVTTAEPAHRPDLSTPHTAVTWLEANYLNVHAAVGYAAAHGYRDHAIAITAAMNGFLLARGHWSQGLELYHLALEAAQAASDRPAAADLLADIGGLLYLTGDGEKAIVSLSQAMDIYRDLDNQLGQAYVMRRLGAVRLSTGDYPAAETSFTGALAIFRQEHDILGQAEALSNLGVVQYEKGDLQTAAESQGAALDLFLAVGSVVAQADALCYLGEIHTAAGRFADAIAACTDALELYLQSGGPWHEAGALYYLGTGQRTYGDTDSARASLTKALGLYRQIGDLFDEAGVLNQLGMLCTATGRPEDAATSLIKAMDIYRQFKSSNGEAEVLNSMGELALVQGDIGRARDAHQSALAIVHDMGARREEARALEGIGRCLLESGERAAAIASLCQAREIYEYMESPHAARIAALLTTLDDEHRH
jgi:tetratricopeptide (TPR) repeat protein